MDVGRGRSPQGEEREPIVKSFVLLQAGKVTQDFAQRRTSLPRHCQGGVMSQGSCTHCWHGCFQKSVQKI